MIIIMYLPIPTCALAQAINISIDTYNILGRYVGMRPNNNELITISA